LFSYALADKARLSNQPGFGRTAFLITAFAAAAVTFVTEEDITEFCRSNTDLAVMGTMWRFSL
jgi:hypothetical protein